MDGHRAKRGSCDQVQRSISVHVPKSDRKSSFKGGAVNHRPIASQLGSVLFKDPNLRRASTLRRSDDLVDAVVVNVTDGNAHTASEGWFISQELAENRLGFSVNQFDQRRALVSFVWGDYDTARPTKVISRIDGGHLAPMSGSVSELSRCLRHTLMRARGCSVSGTILPGFVDVQQAVSVRITALECRSEIVARVAWRRIVVDY